MPTRAHTVILLVLASVHHAHASTDMLTQRLQRFAENGLAVNEMQRHLDTSGDFTFSRNSLDGAALLAQAEQLMRDKYAGRVDIMQDLLSEVTDQFTRVSSYNPFPDCCRVPVYEFDSGLRQRVDYNRLCVAGNGLRGSGPQEVLPEAFVDYIKTVYSQELGLQYIYFGSEEGVIYNYPAVDFCSDDYDPRYRPFYVETVESAPKDVVLVIDKSGSMGATHNGRSLMSIAIEAAQTVIDTLNSNDRVAVVDFASSANTPPGSSSTSYCYSNTLAMATSENKEYLKGYLGNIGAGGSTHYKNALRAAFRYFNNSNSDANDPRERAKLVIFLTDGEPTDTPHRSILQQLASLNDQVNNEVIMITYGLGRSLGSSAQTLLSNMAVQSASTGEVTEGVFTLVEDPSNLRTEMATYYNLLQTIDTQPQMTFTVPYQDAFGSGLIAAICMPVSVATNGGDRRLRGVICIDQSLGELLSELTYFQIGASSYSFMVDTQTRVLHHPYMANPTYVTNTPVFTFLESLEIGNGVDPMIDSMRRGESGELQTSTRKVVSRGNTDLDGVYTQTHTSRYYWTTIEGTSYIIGLSVATDDTQARIALQGAPHSHFLYHNLELAQRSDSSLQTCSYFGTVSVRDASSLQLALTAWSEPYEYLYRDETLNDLQAYTNYLTSDQLLHNPGFQDQIREYVSATGYFDELMQSLEEFWTVAVWRYLGTENGIIRLYPAAHIPKNYDAAQRQWYVQAKANRDVMTITVPYEDAFGAGTLLTLTHVLYEGKEVHDYNSDLIIGVMGMDITPTYFYYALTATVPECRTSHCLVMDRAGYVVVHRDWFEAPSRHDDWFSSAVHIAEKEPAIARAMVAASVITHQACINITGVRNQYFWHVIATRDVTDVLFDVLPIEGTNAYLVIKKQRRTNSCYSCNTQNYPSCAAVPDDDDCFCPCYRRDRDIYEYCTAEYALTSDSNPICTPPLQYVNFTSVRRSTAEPSCYDYRCPAFSSIRDCNNVTGCSWCQFTSSGGMVDDPHCGLTSECPHGVLFGSDSSSSESDNHFPWWTGLVYAGLVGLMLFVIVLCCICYTRDVDECRTVTDPCSNNGECKNTHGSFICQCDADHTGYDCSETLVVQVTTHVPNKKGGRDSRGGFPWWTGLVIALLVLAGVCVCIWLVCKNSGKAEPRSVSTYTAPATNQQPTVAYNARQGVTHNTVHTRDPPSNPHVPPSAPAHAAVYSVVLAPHADPPPPYRY